MDDAAAGEALPHCTRVARPINLNPDPLLPRYLQACFVMCSPQCRELAERIPPTLMAPLPEEAASDIKQHNRRTAGGKRPAAEDADAGSLTLTPHISKKRRNSSGGGKSVGSSVNSAKNDGKSGSGGGGSVGKGLRAGGGRKAPPLLPPASTPAAVSKVQPSYHRSFLTRAPEPMLADMLPSAPDNTGFREWRSSALIAGPFASPAAVAVAGCRTSAMETSSIPDLIATHTTYLHTVYLHTTYLPLLAGGGSRQRRSVAQWRAPGRKWRAAAVGSAGQPSGARAGAARGADNPSRETLRTTVHTPNLCSPTAFGEVWKATGHHSSIPPLIPVPTYRILPPGVVRAAVAGQENALRTWHMLP